MPLAVERMIRDGNRAGDVIQRLRALTKKTDPQNAPLDINDVINDVVDLVLREVLSHRVRLKRDLVTALNRIIGDRVQFSRSSSTLSRIALKPWQTSQGGSVSL